MYTPWRLISLPSTRRPRGASFEKCIVDPCENEPNQLMEQVRLIDGGHEGLPVWDVSWSTDSVFLVSCGADRSIAVSIHVRAVADKADVARNAPVLLQLSSITCMFHRRFIAAQIVGQKEQDSHYSLV